MQQEFFDINQLPQEEGILLLGISMSRIGNAQSAEKCLEYIKHIGTKMQRTDGVGAVFLYADYLYFHSEESAQILRDRYKDLMLSHKNGFLKLLVKDDPAWIKKAFSFYTFGQIMLDNSDAYKKAFDEVIKLYKADSSFKACVDEDCIRAERETSETGAMFILEEITSFYLAAKGKLSFNNKFVSGTEKWVLQCYPGKPLKSEVYLFQKNPLKLSNPGNKYENSYYDLEAKILYDYTKLDIETFNF